MKRIRIVEIVISTALCVIGTAGDTKSELTTAIEGCIAADLAEPNSAGPNVNAFGKSLGLQVLCKGPSAQTLMDIASRNLPFFDESYSTSSKESKATRRVFDEKALRGFFCVYSTSKKTLPSCFIRLHIEPYIEPTISE